MVRKRDVFLTWMCLMHVAVGALTPAARVNPSECRSLIDLYFVIDGSDSIDAENFKLLREAIASMIPEIDLGPTKARIGMLVYSSHVPDTSEHIFSHDPGYLLNAAMTLQHPRDGTDTRLGIKHMIKIFKEFGRPDVPRVCVVITDGISKDPPATILEADKAAKMGISMFAVGIGHKIAIKELEGIASTDNQVVAISNFGELKHKMKSMMFTICPCPFPQTVPNAKCNDGPRAIGSVRTYECMQGYHRRGNPNIQCQNDFTWTSLAADFECVPCSQTTPVVEHSTCGGDKLTIGSVRTYTCNTGYRGIGKPTIECLKDATWSKPNFECVPCGPTPAIPHAICGGKDLKIGAVRSFTCESGYRLIGKKTTIQCLDNVNWLRPRWSEHDVQCVPCGPTPDVKNGICGGGQNTIGAVRSFTCEAGYRLIGKKTTIQCLDNVDWSQPRWSEHDVQCVPCGPTPDVKNGICGGGQNTIGAVRSFTCEAGYRLIGKKTTIQCLDNIDWLRPKWSEHDVQCVPCGPTPDVKNGICGGGQNTIGAVRSFTCEAGYRLIGKKTTIQCLDNIDWSQPRWSEHDVQCVPCGPTPNVKNGICGGGQNTIGAVRSFTCEAGYRLIGKKTTIQCLDNVDWSQPRWSEHDVQCVPCGPTPDVKNGICGGGQNTIGAVRSFTCEAGYRLIGKKTTIQCLDNVDWSQPRWSEHDVQCVPCGPTPDVKNGICGGGQNTIGAVRSFTCEAGYRLIGKKTTIQCVDNIDWSQPRWSEHDVQCVPCGPTPDVKNGICGGGQNTIGAVRSFTCEAGYRLIGKKTTIQCLDNVDWSQPRWSEHDVQCVPCGPTPDVKNGICGGGQNTIGAVRSFTCEAGYRLIGKKTTIQCLDNIDWSQPRWSEHDVQCVPCGPTPDVKNGICGGGLNTIGAVRSFTCEAGYRLIGKKTTIQCLDNIDWSQPRWSEHDVQCVPCGPTPDVKNGICGGGQNTIGAVRSFTCEAGYRLIGKKTTIQCVDNIDWSQPRWSEHDVQCVPCGPTPDVKNGICGGGRNTIGAVRSFTCEAGYRLIGKKTTIQCLDNVDWSQPRWSEHDVQCVPCGPTPDVKNGICGGGQNTIGAVRSFTCEAGYRLIGKKPTIQCVDNIDWSQPRWSEHDVQCVPCGPTPDVKNGICGGGQNTIGAVRSFTCEAGYRLIGKKTTIQCLDNVDWSQPRWSEHDVQCVPCGPTPDVKNGICGGGQNTIGAVRSFTCEAGYRLIGKKTTIQCLDNVDWSQPRWSEHDVQCVPCGPTPDVKNGICGGGQNTIGAVRSFTCEAGYRLIGKKTTIQCLDNTDWSQPRWSEHDVQCVPCGPTPDVKNGICGGGQNTIGAVRSFTCEAGYRLIGKKTTIQCLDNTDWSQPRWSEHDVQCVPCGPTPDVKNGICGGGQNTIGAVRSFTCEAGYRLIGKKTTIQCLDNIDWSQPKWSEHDVQCVPCGPTPDVKNGICGGGQNTIGAVRSFTCEAGYRLIGKKTTIQCLDNIDWSQPRWSEHDVQCVPCGPTPNVKNGICGGGQNTIGAVRSFTCEAGYRLIGKKTTIQCLDNIDWSQPRWSEHDVQCVPCGPTPDVDHAICGDGDNRIGSRRLYSCIAGYFLDGTREISCLDDGTWSIPKFTCKDCGDPPFVPNAYTGTGPSLIGSERVYYCENGFNMIGRGVVKCNGNGHWEKPGFSCKGIPQKPISNDPSVCDRCRYLNGVGYNFHPFDCSQYVQCFVGNNGLEPVYRKCPFGLFWDQTVLTCRPSHDVDCPHDRCKEPSVNSYKHTDRDNCCAYWKCQNGRSYGECCSDGFSYNSALQQCVTDYECVKTCPYENEIPVSACNKRPTSLETMFEEYVGNNYWLARPCAPGTAFDPVTCQCSLLLMSVPGKRRQQVCKPELYLPFTGGFADRSGNHVPVRPENVSIVNGAALFNGRSRILINRFANTEFHGDLVIKFRYKEAKNGAYFDTLQALVTNGDCGDDPSIVIAKMPGYVLVGAKAEVPRSFALPTLDKEWKEVIYMHNEKRLQGKVCGASMSKYSYGAIQATHCSIQIGYGNGLQSYVGEIDDLYIYRCRPRTSVLNIGY